MAPSEKSDNWALGVMLFEIIAQHEAFDPGWGIAKMMMIQASVPRFPRLRHRSWFVRSITLGSGFCRAK
jgi:hypothetical protein